MLSNGMLSNVYHDAQHLYINMLVQSKGCFMKLQHSPMRCAAHNERPNRTECCTTASIRMQDRSD